MTDSKEPSFANLRDCMSSPDLLYGDAVFVREVCGMLTREFPAVTYWFDGGSLIGALRHNSFVPYDDDIDLCVLYQDFNKHRPQIQRALKNLGYSMKAGQSGAAREEIHGEDMSTYWQVFITKKKAKQILAELHGREPTTSEVDAYMAAPQPYLDFLLVWEMPDRRIQYVGDYYGNQPYNAKDIFPLKTHSILGMRVPIPRQPVKYLKTAYKTDQSPITNAVVWSEHKAGLKPICNQRLRARLMHGRILTDMNAYLREVFGSRLKVTTKKSLKKFE